VDLALGEHDPAVRPLDGQQLGVLGHQVLAHGAEVVAQHLKKGVKVIKF
jgi:hypothetical protein